MMPGIAVQLGLPIAAAPPARTASAQSEHFSQALDAKPKARSRDDRTPDPAGSSDAAADNASVGRTAPAKDDKVDRSAAKDEQDNDAEKDGDDKDKGALPLHMKAERALAQPWPAAAAANGQADVDAPDSADDAGTANGQGAAAGLANGGGVLMSGLAAPAAAADSAAAAATAGGAMPAAGGKPAQFLANLPAQAQAAGTPAAPAGDGGSAAAPTAAAGLVPAAGVSVSVAAGTEAASPSAAFMAKVAAMDHAGKPAAQGISAPAPASTGDGQAAAMPAVQETTNAGVNPDGEGKDEGGSAQSKGAQNAAIISAVAKRDSAATPLPTAQMVPSSGSAASFAAALAGGGRLARYTTAASAAAASGAPAGALPVQSLRIQLQPVELGAVTANLKYSGSHLTIDIEVETPDAQRRLSGDSSDIVKSLQSLGFQVDKVTVRQAQPQAQTQSPTQGQPQGQSAARDGSAGGFAGQGGSPFSMSGQSERQAGQHRQGSESGYEDAAERGIGLVQQVADRLPRRGVFI
ncbi:MAG: flagellar hook-length control protein FliK [Rhizobiaceae bacterium]